MIWGTLAITPYIKKWKLQRCYCKKIPQTTLYSLQKKKKKNHSLKQRVFHIASSTIEFCSGIFFFFPASSLPGLVWHSLKSVTLLSSRTRTASAQPFTPVSPPAFQYHPPLTQEHQLRPLPPCTAVNSIPTWGWNTPFVHSIHLQLSSLQSSMWKKNMRVWKITRIFSWFGKNREKSLWRYIPNHWNDQEGT